MGPMGQLIPHMSARYIREQFYSVYQSLGGAERLLHEANRDADSYKWFISLMAKLTPREALVQHDHGAAVDSLIDRLDKEDKAKTIEADFVEVSDATE